MENIYKKIINEKYIGREINPIKQEEIYKIASKNTNIKTLENNVLLIIDAQRDFIDMEKGALPVNGAIEDIKKINRFIFNNLENLSNIYVTMDTHKYNSIFHPILWKNKLNEEIAPFTEITIEKILNEEVIPIYKDIQIEYVETLSKQGSKNLMVWPYHCIYGTDGWLLEKQLNNMLLFFEYIKKINIKRIIKGLDNFTEMYGAIKPEVINKSETQYDAKWVSDIINFDKIYICGEAKDYCVYETVKQFCEKYSNNIEITSKVNMMMNCSSAITDIEECNNKYVELSNKYKINLIEI